jgi:hypothetical protein
LVGFLGFFPRPFGSRRIGFSPQWRLCASVETSLDDDGDDDVLSGLSCFAHVCLGRFFFFFFGVAWLCFTRCFLFPGEVEAVGFALLLGSRGFRRGEGFYSVVHMFSVYAFGTLLWFAVVEGRLIFESVPRLFNLPAFFFLVFLFFYFFC